MRKNRREVNPFEGYSMGRVNIPDSPEISSYVCIPSRTIYINMAAYPDAIITRLVQDNESMAALALSIIKK